MKPEASRSGHVVARVNEIPVGGRKIVTVARRTLGVFNVQGKFFALRNVCPHRGAPVCLGRLRPQVEACQGPEFTFKREGEILKCPWHQWEFDIRTGHALHSAGMKIRTFPVVQEGQDLVVYL